MDRFSPSERSKMMARVRSEDTGPELVVRKLIFALGFRYRLHVKALPGRPDIVFRRMQKVIFVHGCFWHRHEGCRLAQLPKSHSDFWLAKLEANKQRDERNRRDLVMAGWKVMAIWSCELKDTGKLCGRIQRFLELPT